MIFIDGNQLVMCLCMIYMVMQRVNLFEKMIIPEASENIRLKWIRFGSF